MAQAKKALAKKQRTNPEARTRSNTYLNYIGGRWVPSQSGEWHENRNPADTRDLVGRFPVSTTEDVDAAVAAARDAFDAWRLDRKSTRLNSSHLGISYAVFCLK